MYIQIGKLKNIRPDVFINEDLTKHRFIMLKKLLELKKEKVISNAWSNDGRLFAWKNGTKILVKNAKDIDNLKIK
jgi:hypothetical protein